MIPLLYQSLWRDEAFSFFLARKSPLEIVTLTTSDYSPPLYYLVLHYWMSLFGESEPVIRLLSVFFHLGSVLLAFLIVRKLTKSPLPPLLVGASILLNPYLIHYAFETRMYSMLAFLILATIWFLLNKKLFLGGLFLGLAIFTHNYASFYALSLGLLWFAKSKKPSLKELTRFSLVPILALFSWIWVILSQWSQIESSFWLSKPNLATLLETLNRYILGHSSSNFDVYLYGISLTLIMVALYLWFFSKVHPISTKIILALVLILPIILSLIVSLSITPIYHDRYHIAFVYLAILSIGYILSSKTSRSLFKHLKTLLVLSYFALLLPSSLNTLQQPTNQAIKDSVNQVLDLKKGSVVVTLSPLNFLETKYYFRQKKSNIPLYTFSKDSSIPSYIGAVIFAKDDIITKLPDNNYWLISPSGEPTYVP